MATEHRYHNQALGGFLSARSIPHRWEGSVNLFVDHPELVVVGGGRFGLNLLASRLRV